MADEQTQKITINEKEYDVANMTEQQLQMLRQISSIDGKLTNLQNEAEQLQAARTFFINNLTALMEAPVEDNVVDELPEE
tara:strand:+ start:2943 stop:3182 length:240 start_codon:yes stop_codon:yes gene_type:complete